MKHTILFDREAHDWNEAIPVGNGFLGAMIHGGARRERLQINEDSVWSGGPMNRSNPDAARTVGRVRSLLLDGDVEGAQRLAERSLYSTVPDMRHYEPLGDVWIDFPDYAGDDGGDGGPDGGRAGAPAVRRGLDVDEAVAFVDRMSGGSDSAMVEDFGCDPSLHAECFASNPDDVLVYRIESVDGKTPFSCTVTASRNDVHNGLIWRCEGVGPIDDRTIRLHGVNGGADGIGYEMAVRVIADDGEAARTGVTIDVTDARSVTVLIAGRTTFRTSDPAGWCMAALDAASARSYGQLRARHIADYRALYDRGAITFDDDIKDPSLESLPTSQRLRRVADGGTDIGLWETYLAFGRYLLISSSRPGSLPATLQGIWNRDYEPAWGSKYTININAEMNYWFAERAGLGELHTPLLEHVRRMDARGREVARAMYGARGFVAHHNTDIWGDCAPQDACMTASVWPLGGAWLSLHIAEHYRYTRDRAFIDRYFDVLRDAVLFFTDTMIRDADGYWAVGPSLSPEHAYRTADGRDGVLCIGSTMDNQILHDLFGQYLAVAHDLGRDDDDLAADARERLAGLRPTQIGADGRIMEWPRDRADTEPGHRHFSPLFALFPGHDIRVDRTPELAEAAAAFIKRRMEHGSGATGWSKAWVIALYARLRDRGQVWSNIVRLLADSTLDNLFDNHPPFQIDGNFGAVAAMYETLLQDYGDEAFVLPALPDALASGHAHGVVLEAGASVDLSWRDGRVRELILTGLRDGEVRLTGPSGAFVDVLFTAGQRITVDPTVLHGK
ncbi:glycoside hydrolase family 95 protein [Bifidobacterium sp. SO1]|uniref:glycoside hydrolase family 95 protein n=1 Tax=Bifidobacterium sp. SO1 TaxID=2809029 RepID=UPI001BDC0309|nr:glycoside hydrolase family 95 protein [Bifidobacterium sp. SO1]MBT1162037.1 glycoside hydrolase family 95 protein [Bifidobacterium sp. SO1]